MNLDNYPCRMAMPTRWNDVSGDGCVSHVSLARYMEDARVVLLKQVMSHSPVRQHALRVFVARLYLEQTVDVFYPQELMMGAGISRLGSSSYTIAIGVFLDGDCIGLSETVNVSVDDKGRPAPIPEEHRNYLLAESIGQDLQLAVREKPSEECFQASRYPHVCTFDTRFSDTDRLGHINNVAIVRYYDDALAQLLSGCYSPAESLKPGWHGKTVRADVSFSGESHHSLPLRIASGIRGVEDETLILEQALFQNDACVGVREAIVVLPTISPTLQQKLLALQVHENR